ncbi:response regulator transcription factor [Paenibacillus sp. 1P07SE]|uniref:response regulator transcription factor n=1 Tax=Paenibacillus sp. 1P07SE TaxID=3132209 RepID=UPI0039A74039
MKGKLFIAEDQPNFRKGLLKLAGKRSSEWIVAGEAANGQAALLQMEACIPDLLITDIRMPGMDGLQLTREIRSRGWKTKIVIITGFKDFAYAQSALKFGVLDFITKPCVEADILSLLDRTYIRLQEEHQSQRLIEEWRQQHEDSQLRSAMLGISCNPGELEMLLGRMEAGEVCFLSVPAYASGEKLYTAQDIPLLQYAVVNIMREHLQHWFGDGYRLIPLTVSQWALLVDRAASAATLPASWLDTLSRSVRQYLKLSLVYSSAVPCRMPEDLQQSYERYGVDPDRGAGVEAYALGDSLIDQAALHEKESQILALLMSGDNSQLGALLQQQADTISSLPLQKGKIEALLLATALIRQVQVQFSEWPMSSSPIAWSDLYTCDSPQAITAWLQAHIEGFLDAHQAWLDSKNDTPVKQAVRFIQDKYMEACGLSEVAAHVHLNPSYFSNLFKKETGESVTGYIQSLRMQKAKLLLGSTDMKIFEIAEAVGFNDSNYFTHMFNKLEGRSPKEYRRQMGTCAPS